MIKWGADWTTEMRLIARAVEMDSGCVEWRGATNGRRYGVIHVGPPGGRNKHSLAHRVVWEMANGPVPKGMYVCHTCDNPPCMRLDHLFLGTPRENRLDCKRKGRERFGSPVGEVNPAARLTGPQAIEIRRLCDVKAASRRSIALAYGVSESAVDAIAWRRISPGTSLVMALAIASNALGYGRAYEVPAELVVALAIHPQRAPVTNSPNVIPEIIRALAEGEMSRMRNGQSTRGGTIKRLAERIRAAAESTTKET